MPGAFKLDHLQPVEPILSGKFSNFFIFILGSPILITPEGGREALKRRKGNLLEMDEIQEFRKDKWRWNGTTGKLVYTSFDMIAYMVRLHVIRVSFHNGSTPI